MSEKISVIVVDDHEFFRQGVIMTLSRFENTEVLGEAANGKEVLELLKKKRPDLVLMDIKMPEMNGVEATEMISREYPDVKVVALSMFSEEEYLEQMLQVGTILICWQSHLLTVMGIKLLIGAVRAVRK